VDIDNFLVEKMKAFVILSNVRFPIFSIKAPEAFQVGQALPFPQPSALIGALAYCIAIKNKVGSKDAIEKAKKIALAARAGGIPEKQFLIPSPIILWRFRILDRAMELPKKGKGLPMWSEIKNAIEANNYVTAKRIIEIRTKDALYREYVFTTNILAVWVLSTHDIEGKDLYAVQRFGDTESLCTITSCMDLEVEIKYKDLIVTIFPSPVNCNGIKASIFSGEAILLKMCDESRQIKWFYVPVKHYVVKLPRGGRVGVFQPTLIKLKYDRRVKVVEIPVDSLKRLVKKEDIFSNYDYIDVVICR